MSHTTTYQLVRTGVFVALIAGGTAACHYKGGTQYVNDSDIPRADSGTRRISTTTMRSDSLQLPADSLTTRPADSTTAKPASAEKPANAEKTHATSMNRPPVSAKSVGKAKFTHGRASVTAPRIYTTAEVAPVFPGGQKGLDNYINHTVKYPQQAIDDDVSGTVHVSFVVDEQGHVTKARVMDAAHIGDGLDEEALRVVKNMPAWTPGMVKGKKVRTRMELPINFQVES